MLKTLVLTTLFATVRSTSLGQLSKYVEELWKLPFEVSIGSYGAGNKVYSHHCGGSIISANWVLTAAQCSRHNIEIVLAGSHFKYDNGIYSRHSPIDIIPHPLFASVDKKGFINDIMLIRVAVPFQWSNTEQFLLLFYKNEKSPVGSIGTLSHWASVNNGGAKCEYFRILNPVNVTIIEPSICHGFWNNRPVTYAEKICTAYADDYNYFCVGDAGAPLISFSAMNNSPALAGILSYPSVKEQKQSGEPEGVVYTRVAFYRDWIRSVSNV